VSDKGIGKITFSVGKRGRRLSLSGPSYRGRGELARWVNSQDGGKKRLLADQALRTGKLKVTPAQWSPLRLREKRADWPPIGKRVKKGEPCTVFSETKGKVLRLLQMEGAP